MASGSVISESPTAGTQVNAGSAVSLVVSTGVAQVAVPNVVSQTQAAATTAIQTAGLVVGTVTTASSSTVASGSVISESLTAGTQVNAGSAVSLVVSTGWRSSSAECGWADAGRSDDGDSGGRPGGGNGDYSIEQHGCVGNVISESPGAGTQVNAGSAVNLVVSTGAAQVAVPNVVGQTQAAATTAIQAAGLVVGTVTTASSSTVAAGSVISESPGAGTQVNAGSAVGLVVSSGPSTPSVVSVSPSSGTGISQTFVATYSDTGGAAALFRRLFVVSATQSGAAHDCYVQAQSSGIYLANDAGTSLLGPVNASNSVSNSQCTLDGSGTSMTNSGNTSTLTLSLTFKPAYFGAMNIGMLASDLNGATSGWQTMGTFQVGP